MKDVFDNELAAGDTVAFTEPGYVYELKTGTILRFTTQKLEIEWVDRKKIRKTLKFPMQVAKKVTV